MFPVAREHHRSLLPRVLLACCVVVMCASPIAWSQEASSAGGDDRDASLAAYLESHDQLDALAAHLRSRIATAQQGDARLAHAERLSRLYVRMLASAQEQGNATMVSEVATRAAALLREVPQADSYELRLDLAKATYLPNEERAERGRLRMLGSEETGEVVSAMRESATTFGVMGDRLSTLSRDLEARERSAAPDDQERLRRELGDARQLRSLARYYEGWARHYVALLTGDKGEARSSIVAFGALLNAVPDREPSIERFPTNSLRYEHVCRTVLGVSMGYAMLDKDVEALRWIEQLETSQDVPASMHDALFTRKLIVLAQTARWADASLLVRKRRGASGVLSPLEARLLATLALESLRDVRLASREQLRALATEAAQQAMGDLIAQDMAGQVVDLVRRYGTLPLGETGFIAMYVKGTEAFEASRDAHRASEPPGDTPARLPESINRYRQAAELLASALTTDDAVRFPREQAPAALRRGLSLYYAGDLREASEAFERAVSLASAPVLRGDAMWYGIVALEGVLAASPQDEIVRTRLDRLSTLYIKEFPTSENATRLLLRTAGASGRSDEETLALLLAVAPDSPLFEAARSQASVMLYRSMRRATPRAREAIALRFADVTEDLLRREHARALGGVAGMDEASQRRVASQVVTRARQLTEALLTMSVPDLPRVEAALAMLEQTASRHGMDLSDIEDELTLRRLQIALAREDVARARVLGDGLRGRGGAYARAAEGLWLARAERAFLERPGDAVAARELVVIAKRMLDAGGVPAQQAATLRDRAAAAAEAVWRIEQDKAMRDMALALDGEQLASGARTHASLRRLGILHEEAGSLQLALDAWIEILAGFDPPAEAWYEARARSLSLLARLDPRGAEAALQQTRALHSKPWPKPWDAVLERVTLEIEGALARLPAPAAVPSAGPAAVPTGGGGR